MRCAARSRECGCWRRGLLTTSKRRGRNVRQRVYFARSEAFSAFALPFPGLVIDALYELVTGAVRFYDTLDELIARRAGDNLGGIRGAKAGGSARYLGLDTPLALGSASTSSSTAARSSSSGAGTGMGISVAVAPSDPCEVRSSGVIAESVRTA